MEQQVSEITPGNRPPVPEQQPAAAGALGTLRALGPARLAALGAVALALLGFFTYLVLRVSAPDYALLYGGLDLADSGAIVSRLEAMGVPYRLRGEGGDAILVPRERVHRLRMALAEEGLLRGGTVGYEIFDSTSALGTTNFLTDVNLKRALEGELARTIGALDDVRAARVHLVLPKRELFRRERVDPSASVMLRMQRGVEPSRRQVLAIQHVVAAAVPGLRPEQVAVADERGTLLARGGGGDGGADGALLTAQNEELKAAYEERLKRTIEELLARSLGPGRVRAEVHADIDFDRVETTSETFDPDSQVARSTQSVEEETRSSEQDRNDAVSVANNLPNEGAALGGGSTSSEQTTRSEETVNFEISRTVRNQVKVGGQIRRLSVAVLVDGIYEPGAGAGGGERVYRPRGDDELARLAALVRSAVGFDAARGDVVEIINMPFAEAEQVEPAAEGWAGLDAADLRRLAEILTLALVAALLVLFVLRPAVGRLLPAPAGAAAALPQPQQLAPAGAAAGGGGAGDALAGPDGRPALPAAAGDGAGRGEGVRQDGEPEEEDEAEAQARLLREVLEFVEKSPDEAVTIIRGWLHEG